jgi:hypothetical protein
VTKLYPLKFQFDDTVQLRMWFVTEIADLHAGRVTFDLALESEMPTRAKR